jgi:hypothetical protein
MVRYVIYTPDGIIRAVVVGDLAIAEANIRLGESLLIWDGHVTATGHKVENGVVVEIPPTPPTLAVPGPRTRS